MQFLTFSGGCRGFRMEGLRNEKMTAFIDFLFLYELTLLCLVYLCHLRPRAKYVQELSTHCEICRRSSYIEQSYLGEIIFIVVSPFFVGVLPLCRYSGKSTPIAARVIHYCHRLYS